VTAAQLGAAKLVAAKARLEMAEINLAESTITSPLDGVVTARHVDAGNLITEGTAIVTIADTATVRVIVALAERYASEVGPGTPARIRVDAYPENEFEAAVYSVYPALDRQTHTLQVEIRLDNERLLLKPGMFARVTLVAERKEDVVVISRDVVLGGKINEPYVYVVNNDVAHKRLVKLGITQAARCEIVEGLNPGEKVVTDGMHYLIDGAAVEVVHLEDIR